jgi:hybrid cluster-associated redox disulfide protein
MPIRHDSVVDDLMRNLPATIRAFLDFRMGCCGCPIATFHTVDDACREHDVDREVFLIALRETVENQDLLDASESREPASASTTSP